MRRATVLMVGSLFFATSVTSAKAQTFPDATCFGKPWTILGTEGRDEIVGTQRADVIVARGGSDSIDGAEGNDLICGGDGTDTIRGNDGDDRIDGGRGPSRQRGGRGNDVLIGGVKFDELIGMAGNDRLRGGGGLDLFDGGRGSDRMNGGDFFDYVFYDRSPNGIAADLSSGVVTGDGADRVTEIEAVVGSKFDDGLFGDGAFLNSLLGLGGNDTIEGRSGRDIVAPGPGDDIVGGGSGADDVISFVGGQQAVNVDLVTGTATGYGTDLLSGFEEIFGSDADDVLAGDANDNVITGGIGADDVQGRGGNDRLIGEGFVVAFNNDGNRDDSLDGGDGTDTVSYAAAERSIFVDLANAEGRGEGNDTLTSIENVRGSAFNDTLIGDAAANAFFGRNGDDVLDGAAGDDTLDGGPGSDRATGGAGNDTCTRAETRTGCEKTTTTMQRHVGDRGTDRAARAGLLGVRRRH